jgi:hypothetical protein
MGSVLRKLALPHSTDSLKVTGQNLWRCDMRFLILAIPPVGGRSGCCIDCIYGWGCGGGFLLKIQ